MAIGSAPNVQQQYEHGPGNTYGSPELVKLAAETEADAKRKMHTAAVAGELGLPAGA